MERFIMPEVTARTAADRYGEALPKIAEMIHRLNELAEQFDYLSDRLVDNADPKSLADEALVKLGALLAACVTYRTEYEAEAVPKTPQAD